MDIIIYVGALLECKDLILSKRIKIIGIDYNEFYIQAAKEAIDQANLQEFIHVSCISVYETEKIDEFIQTTCSKTVNHIYFSGSFSLLPDPMKALTSVLSSDCISKEAKIFITQTYQRRTPLFLATLKPLMKYITSIDFGTLITEDEIQTFHQQVIQHIPSLALQQHSIIPNSLDNPLQAAYLTIFQNKVN